ncbi:MAG: SDR family oxidoreductase [Frankiaceae bacterium]|nr:SDR family oxidoreductase [Frankiaceae bacterium]
MADKGWVFVTGASTGIGRASVEQLVTDGWQVIAGVRRDGDQPPTSTAHVLIDVSDGEQVATATKQVLELCDGRLAGLVNNAGISVAGPFEGLSLDEWRRQFDVNFFGQIDVTQRLLPAVLAASGRVVNIGSIGGRMASPFLGPYNASKFAVRAWTDAMRAELAPHGVRVVLVEPGSIATEIWRKGNDQADDVLDRLDDEKKARYARQAAGAKKAAATVERNAIPAAKVGEVVASALSKSKPKTHYVVGVDAKVQAFLAKLPASATDKVVGAMMRPPKDA